MSTIDELEAKFRAAQAAAEAYSTEITQKYRTEIPDSPDWTGAGPDPDAAYARAKAVADDERAELARLRQAATDAAVALHRARQQAGAESGGD